VRLSCIMAKPGGRRPLTRTALRRLSRTEHDTLEA